MSELHITHYTKTLPGIIRKEIYECDDIQYIEEFDDLTGKRMVGEIKMYNGITVCYVTETGLLDLDFPTQWVSNRKDMMTLIDDLKRLDNFIAAIL